MVVTQNSMQPSFSSTNDKNLLIFSQLGCIYSVLWYYSLKATCWIQTERTLRMLHTKSFSLYQVETF